MFNLNICISIVKISYFNAGLYCVTLKMFNLNICISIVKISNFNAGLHSVNC